jgi:lysophospholipase L1-like esterase
MNWTRISLATLAICALAAVIVRGIRPDEHRNTRQLILHYTLSRVDEPIIVIGDSIVEASTLPRTACGHPIVNAGLNGASTASDLGNWLAPALDGKRAAIIVLSLGTNDALTSSPESKESFGESYGALLARLRKLSRHLAVIQILPVETRGRMTAEMQSDAMRTISIYNSILPELADRNGAAFVTLPAMPSPYTIDGVHLNAGGYEVWEKAVIQGAAKACG